MPPKAVPEAKPKAGVKRPRSAIGESEEVQAPAKKRQSGADRSLEFDVEKALKDNFKGFRDFQLRMILDEEGNSVEDRVRQRKQLNEEDNTRYPCGKNFYKELKEEYFAKAGNLSGFPAVPGADTQAYDMFKCVKVVIRHNRGVLPMQTYLETCEALKTLNLHGLLGATIKTNPGGKRGEVTEFILDVMKFIIKHDHHTSHAESVAVAKPHFDNA